MKNFVDSFFTIKRHILAEITLFSVAKLSKCARVALQITAFMVFFYSPKPISARERFKTVNLKTGIETNYENYKFVLSWSSKIFENYENCENPHS